MEQSSIPLRAFGNTGRRVTLTGLGGEGVLRTHGREREASAVIQQALAEGICYYDCARAYAGSEGYYGRVWRRQPERRAQVFQAGKSACRSAAGALEDLELTLDAMGIDHLDLWQIHDVRTHEELDRIAAPQGALEAFVEAKRTGRAQFIGVTGHHDPEVLLRAIREWPMDSVMLPVNPVEKALGGFLEEPLAAAREKGLAVIAMKVLGASHYLYPDVGVTASQLVRFALSQPVSVAIVGCSTEEHVRTLARAGRSFIPMTEEEQQMLVDLFRPHVRRLAFYRGVR